MAHTKNIRVENMTHEDEQEEEGPHAEITAAVKRQLEGLSQATIKRMEERSEQTIQEAVKRALEKQGCQGSSTKKQKKQPEFKSKGNQLRYEVNEEAIGNKELDLAKATLETGKSILTKQQKFIRIADREENGWEIVQHCLSDELASDSDDENAICRAKREALVSITKRKAKKRSNFGMPLIIQAKQLSVMAQDAGVGEIGFTPETELRSIDESCQRVMPVERRDTPSVQLYI